MGILSEYKTVKQIVSAKHDIIVYAENRFYYQYFKELVAALIKTENRQLVYITSDKNDPLLQFAPAGVQVFYVFWWLAFLFPRLNARLVITSMTDLHNFAFKRSKDARAYVYVFHAAVSTHLQYSQNAFFHYDAIFVTGHYQEAEIRAAEKIHHLPPKDIVHFGYPIIDLLATKMAAQQSAPATPVILIAPSWFEGCIFDTCITQLVEALSQLPYHVIIRPHPEYVKRKKKAFTRLEALAADKSSISFDYSEDVVERLMEADILITDRSGIAIEYALGIGRPVLFIETALKIMNPQWKETGIEPIENQLRSQIGVTVPIEEINNIAEKMEQLASMRQSFAKKAALLRQRFLFDHAIGLKNGVNYIQSRLQ